MLESATAAAITLAVLLAYWPSLALGWWREDYTWLFGPVRFPALLWDFANGDTLGRYRPVTKLMLAAVGSLGLDARLPSRILCLLLLVTLSTLLARFVREVTRNPLAGLVAGLTFVASQRMAVIVTFVTFSAMQLYAIFALVALTALVLATAGGDAAPVPLQVPGSAAPTKQRPPADGAGRALWMAGLAFLAALGSFEVAVNLPVAMAALLIVSRARDGRAWALVGAVGAIVAAFSWAHLASTGVPQSHHPSLGAVGSNLLTFADHEAEIAILAALASALLAFRRSLRRSAAMLGAVAATGLLPGLLFPLPPDSYIFVLTYLGACGLIGLATAELLQLGLRAAATLPWVATTVAVVLSLGAGIWGRLGVSGLIESEWEMRDSRLLLNELERTHCLGHQPATIAPLGLDERDRRMVFTTKPGEPTVLSGVCGAPVRFVLDPGSLATPECEAGAYFLTRDGDLADCPTVAPDPGSLLGAIACGVPLDSEALLRPHGVWSGPKVLCMNTPRGEGITKSDPPIVLEGDQAVLRTTASISFVVPDGASRFEARIDRLSKPGSPGEAPSAVRIYLDEDVALTVPIGHDATRVPIELSLEGAALVTVAYEAPKSNDHAAIVLFSPRIH